jgi:hypothetical protein
VNAAPIGRVNWIVVAPGHLMTSFMGTSVKRASAAASGR